MVWTPYARFNKLGNKIPYVSTVHDLIDYNRSGDNYRIPFEKNINDAREITAISTYVREDIIKTLNVDADKIHVIPNSIQYRKIDEEPVEEIAVPYILDVNGFREHKNTITLIKAFNKIKDKISCNLVLCAGGKNEDYYYKILDCLKEYKLENRVVILFQVTEGKLEWLYNHAELFVNPSTQEGFGRTPVEAALHKIPVLTTKETSLYEVTMGMLEYIENPYDENEMASKILKILKQGVDYNISEVEELYKRKYDIKNIADMYWSFFMSVI